MWQRLFSSCRVTPGLVPLAASLARPQEVLSRNIERAEGVDLAVVLDVSGSMARESRIELVKRALALLLGQLGPGDRVGLVVYGSQGRVLLEPTSDLPAVRRAMSSQSVANTVT